MKVMTYNSLFGGWDAEDSKRHQLQADVVRSIHPDVLLFQEARSFEQSGARRLFEVERAFGMRGLLAIAPHTGQNTAVFVQPHVEVLGFEQDSVHFHHVAATAILRVPGFEQPVTFVSAHLCPLSPHVRMTEASYLLQSANPKTFTLVGGDFNSVSPLDPEPAWAELAQHHRTRYMSDGRSADRRVLQSLYDAGFVDLGHQLGRNGEPTVPGAKFENTEFVPFRSDYFLASPPLATRASSYAVVRDERTDAASDHYPLVVEFSS